MTWEEPYDRNKFASLQTAIPPELKQKLNEIGNYKVTSEITISRIESKQKFTVEYVLKEGDADAIALLNKTKAILKDREFKMTVHGAKVTQTTRIQ